MGQKSIQSSKIHADDLSAAERLKICQKAVHIVSEMEVQLLENNIKESAKSKYYILTEERIVIDESEDSSSIMENSDGDRSQSILQAFQCPTAPRKIYIHVNDDEDDHILSVILKKENDQQPIFDVLGYQLILSVDVNEGTVLINH